MKLKLKWKIPNFLTFPNKYLYYYLSVILEVTFSPKGIYTSGYVNNDYNSNIESL